MKITFPHLGNSCFAAKAVFDGLGIDYVIPPLSNKRALEIGSLYSPEEMCLPFKITLGNYIESIEKGADTVIITGSCGPCRFGEYCELQMNILKKLGYNIDFIVFDDPHEIGKDEFLKRVGKISLQSTKSNMEKIRALKYGYQVINLIDKIEANAKELAGYEVNKGECKKILHDCKMEALKSKNPQDMVDILKAYKKKIDNVSIDKKKEPLHIAIMGEIYTIIEPFSNLYIEDKLMDYGVSVKKKLTPSWWFNNLLLKGLKLDSIDIKYASRKYMPYYIGGHAKECIGEAVISHNKGLDGAIQIFPMGCMPEIVSKAVLPVISKDKDFPIMTLIVDEMTGEAGYITRIEAFIDLLERRKEKKHVLYGS